MVQSWLVCSQCVPTATQFLTLYDQFVAELLIRTPFYDRTLQELIAPSLTMFLDKNWIAIGYKQAANHDLTYLHAALPKVRLNDRIAKQTGIPGLVLHDQSQLFKLSPEARLS